MKRLPSLLLACAASLAIGGCTPLLVQNPGQGLSPVNAIASGEARHLMLLGYDVVSYFTEKAERAGDPGIKILDGKLYMFGGDGSHDAFMLRPRDNLALANKYWDEEVDGSNAFFQRTKRVIFRVPHWKTSAELADEVARSRK